MTPVDEKSMRFSSFWTLVLVKKKLCVYLFVQKTLISAKFVHKQCWSETPGCSRYRAVCSTSCAVEDVGALLPFSDSYL